MPRDSCRDLLYRISERILRFAQLTLDQDMTFHFLLIYWARKNDNYGSLAFFFEKYCPILELLAKQSIRRFPQYISRSYAVRNNRRLI